jgi:cyclohexadienyl dehydratase
MRRRDVAKALTLGGAALVAAGAAQDVSTAQAQGTTKSRLARILERGIVRVGTTGDFNPMSFRDVSSNEYKGFDISAMEQLAKDLSVKVEWIATDWAQLVAGIAADRFDVFAGGSSINMARARTAAFTIPYIDAGTVPLSLKANANRFASWDAINAAGVRVAVSMGTVFEEQAKRHFPKADIKSVQAPATGYQEVLAGRADVTITSNIEASTLVKRFEQLVVDVQGAEMRNKRPFGYVVGQDDFAWQSCLNTWIVLKKSEGLFDELERTWLLRA